MGFFPCHYHNLYHKTKVTHYLSEAPNARDAFSFSGGSPLVPLRATTKYVFCLLVIALYHIIHNWLILNNIIQSSPPFMGCSGASAPAKILEAPARQGGFRAGPLCTRRQEMEGGKSRGQRRSDPKLLTLKEGLNPERSGPSARERAERTSRSFPPPLVSSGRVFLGEWSGKKAFF